MGAFSNLRQLVGREVIRPMRKEFVRTSISGKVFNNAKLVSASEAYNCYRRIAFDKQEYLNVPEPMHEDDLQDDIDNYLDKNKQVKEGHFWRGNVSEAAVGEMICKAYDHMICLIDHTNQITFSDDSAARPSHSTIAGTPDMLFYDPVLNCVYVLELKSVNSMVGSAKPSHKLQVLINSQLVTLNLANIYAKFSSKLSRNNSVSFEKFEKSAIYPVLVYTHAGNMLDMKVFEYPEVPRMDQVKVAPQEWIIYYDAMAPLSRFARYLKEAMHHDVSIQKLLNINPENGIKTNQCGLCPYKATCKQEEAIAAIPDDLKNKFSELTGGGRVTDHTFPEISKEQAKEAKNLIVDFVELVAEIKALEGKKKSMEPLIRDYVISCYPDDFQVYLNHVSDYVGVSVTPVKGRKSVDMKALQEDNPEVAELMEKYTTYGIGTWRINYAWPDNMLDDTSDE